MRQLQFVGEARRCPITCSPDRGDISTQVAGVQATPAFFINGRFLNGARPYDDFAKIIDDEIERAKQAGAARQ